MFYYMQGLRNAAKQLGPFTEPMVKLFEDCISAHEGIRFKKDWIYDTNIPL